VKKLLGSNWTLAHS